MNLLEHVATFFVYWLLVATVTAGALCVCIARHKARDRADIVRRIRTLPPVPKPTTPPFTQTLADPSWFEGIPSDCLSDDAVHSLFDDMVSGFRVIEGTEQ